MDLTFDNHITGLSTKQLDLPKGTPEIVSRIVHLADPTFECRNYFSKFERDIVTWLSMAEIYERGGKEALQSAQAWEDNDNQKLIYSQGIVRRSDGTVSTPCWRSLLVETRGNWCDVRRAEAYIKQYQENLASAKRTLSQDQEEYSLTFEAVDPLAPPVGGVFARASRPNVPPGSDESGATVHFDIPS